MSTQEQRKRQIIISLECTTGIFFKESLLLNYLRSGAQSIVGRCTLDYKLFLVFFLGDALRSGTLTDLFECLVVNQKITWCDIGEVVLVVRLVYVLYIVWMRTWKIYKWTLTALLVDKEVRLIDHPNVEKTTIILALVVVAESPWLLRFLFENMATYSKTAPNRHNKRNLSKKMS